MPFLKEKYACFSFMYSHCMILFSCTFGSFIPVFSIVNQITKKKIGINVMPFLLPSPNYNHKFVRSSLQFTAVAFYIRVI